MYEIPSYITHYYNAGSDILKNVCSQSDDVAEEFLSSLRENGKRGWLHPGYLEERRRVLVLAVLGTCLLDSLNLSS